jgi:hypothetical protein
MTWFPIAFYAATLTAILVVAARCERPSRRNPSSQRPNIGPPILARNRWFRHCSASDRDTYKRWSRVVAMLYAAVIVCGVAVAWISSADQQAGRHLVARGSARTSP